MTQNTSGNGPVNPIEAQKILAEKIYGGETEAGAFNQSTATTAAAAMFAGVRAHAVHGNHREDTVAIDEDASDYAAMLQREALTQSDQRELTGALATYVSRPLTAERKREDAETATAAARRLLQSRHGVFGADQMVADAKVAAQRMRKHWPGLDRALSNGAGSDADAITALAGLARRKGWTRK